MTIWIATANQHKKRELADILLPHTIRTPDEVGIDFDPEETGATFHDNALIKARALYDLVHEPVIADDSGLCVDALQGRPGVLSARYGSENGMKLDSSDRNALLLKEIGDSNDRSAHFVCAMVLYFSPNRFYVVQETMDGELIHAERGKGGFGYDPILYLPERGKTVAELSDAEKNQISHRGKAGKAIRELLKLSETTPTD
jgi:XTP/dITP diphosphohydrolase